MDELLTSKIRDLRNLARGIVEQSTEPQAEGVDRDGVWPEASLRSLASKGLMGLHVPQRLGGHEEGLLALTVICETLGRSCASTAMCFGMHSVAAAVIGAKATPEQEARYLKPIAAGEHLTTLALSESGTGAHFYLPQATLARAGDEFVVTGTKQFVTNGSHADSYVVSTLSSTPDAEAGEFSCLVVDKDLGGLSWEGNWRGMGMRGNSSRGLRLEGVRVPLDRLLGREGDQTWYVFEVVAPYFLTAMTGVYLGVATRALEETVSHLKARGYAHSDARLGEIPVLQHRLSEMWTDVEKTRAFAYLAARRGDLGDLNALPSLLNSKADVAATAVRVTNEAMTLCGGRAYRENGVLARLLRDARASHVMSPTTDLLRQWAGRAILGVPIL